MRELLPTSRTRCYPESILPLGRMYGSLKLDPFTGMQLRYWEYSLRHQSWKRPGTNTDHLATSMLSSLTLCRRPLRLHWRAHVIGI